MTEFTADGVNYTCHMYISGQEDEFGYGDVLEVSHNANGWNTYWDTLTEYTVAGLGFSSGYSLAYAEAYWDSVAPLYDVTWGPTGKRAWQFKTNSSGCCTTFTNVGAEQTWNDLDFWALNGPPSPFEIIGVDR